MASFSSATRELVIKLVYYGPGLGGKTTTLKALHAAVRQEHRGKMVSLATPVDRTLYFDFLPVRLPSVGELQLRLQLFTVPGQVYFNATRKLVLTGADGIVFVADSQPARLDANTESLGNLRENLAELGRPFESVPIVLAYNKRDLPDVLTPEELDRELNPHGFPALPTSAATGKGVFETLDAVVRLALDDLRQRRVIPAEVQVPADGTIMQRLADVRAAVPSPMIEPMRIVSEEPQRTGSATMPAISPEKIASRPAPAATVVTVATAAPASHAASAMGLAPTLVPAALREEAVSRPPGASAARPSSPTFAYATTPARGIVTALASAAAGAPAAQPATATATGSPSSSALTAIRRGSMLAPLFRSEDQETVRTIEEAMSESILPRAALLLEALLVRVLERAARALGRESAPPEAIAWVLQIPTERYAKLRMAAQRARRGGEIT
ncbi:MAG: GTPase domain-containing protein, partial [Deltaproteobacteria bacterium]